jgi:thiol-disulfide isomerase/thioredoxin
MKIIQLLMVLFILITGSIQSYGQFKLSGKISGYKGNSDLKFNIPLIYGFDKANNIDIPIDKNGNFSIELPITEKRFGNLIFQRKFYTFLLTPGKSLTLICKAKDSTITTISGTAVKENELLAHINLQEPFFMLKGKSFNDSLNSIALIEEKVIKPYFKIRDQSIELVRSADLTAQDKALIIAEIKYNAINNLSHLRNNLTDSKVASEYYLYLFDPLTVAPEILPAGPEYYSFIRNYLGYLGPKAMDNKSKKGLTNQDKLDFYKISYDSANVIANKFGNPYLRWILANNILPLQVTERLTYQEIVNIYNNKDLRQLEPLVNAYAATFPHGKFVSGAINRVSKLKDELTANAKNEKIKIFSNYKTTNSIYDVIKSLKGKVVYLDVWGTWCGPCKEELKHLPKLKERFKNNDLVYVYLDLDDDNMDSSWKEFIKINNMEGIHLRKSRLTIASIWKELLANATDKAEYYPQYFIFDKEGKLVVTKALRPSNEEELYKQLSVYLK